MAHRRCAALTLEGESLVGVGVDGVDGVLVVAREVRVVLEDERRGDLVGRVGWSGERF